ncbi:FAD-binding oxidoreductase [Lysobacter sp. D1-1-M9]|uniref:FAD-binding oxidoreductase n=1 Tax=Novilysobacter longmucuonensis TaxID=3098603 RepID=UPI002FC5EFE3
MGDTSVTDGLDSSTIAQFAASLRGTLIVPVDPGYDEARAVWNGMVDRRPLMIVRCKGAADVLCSINFAREHGLPCTAKAGGHGVAGKSICDDGLVIDLSLMSGVRVDADARTVRVGPGARLGDLDHETQAFGLATTAGTDSRTGVAGLTLGGGIGVLARTHGLAADNLIGADVALADGTLVRASKDENPDIFWALRGGGGNVGIVTSFEFQLHRVGPQLQVVQVFHRLEDAAQVLRFYRDFSAQAPDEVACYALFANIPPAAPFPEELHGKTTLVLFACYSGDPAQGAALLKPVEDFGMPIVKSAQPIPYTTLQKTFDAGTPDGLRYYWKSQFLHDLPDGAIETIVSRIQTLPGALTMGGFEPMGGAINRVNPAATAYPHRDAAFNFSIFAGWNDGADDDAIIGWTREFHDAMRPYSSGGAYYNYLDADEGGRASEAYGENHQRLCEIKAKYDPGNLFRLTRT